MCDPESSAGTHADHTIVSLAEAVAVGRQHAATAGHARAQYARLAANRQAAMQLEELVPETPPPPPPHAACAAPATQPPSSCGPLAAADHLVSQPELLSARGGVGARDSEARTGEVLGGVAVTVAATGSHGAPAAESLMGLYAGSVLRQDD